MQQYAVSFASHDSGELTTEIIEAETWRHAVVQHSETPFVNDDEEPDVEMVPATINETKYAAYDMDTMFSILRLCVVNNQITVEEFDEEEYGLDPLESD